MAKGKKGPPNDPPMSPGDQAAVDQFYERNRGSMDKGNPNFGDTRQHRQEQREKKSDGSPPKTGRWK